MDETNANPILQEHGDVLLLSVHNFTTSEKINELAKALSLAQAEIEPAAKDSENPFFKAKYADLSAVWRVCRGPLTKHGLAIIQPPSSQGNQVKVCTLLLHNSGQWICSSLTMTAKAADPQSIGSALTYARRYGLAAMVGISAEEDDDGNKASGKKIENIQNNGHEQKAIDPLQEFLHEPPHQATPAPLQPASEKQLKAIYALAKAKSIKADDFSLKKFNKKYKELGIKQASELIDDLQKLPEGTGWDE